MLSVYFFPNGRLKEKSRAQVVRDSAAEGERYLDKTTVRQACVKTLLRSTRWGFTHSSAEVHAYAIVSGVSRVTDSRAKPWTWTGRSLFQ
ncbi:hypothetical protein J6590_058164 [Homalodisca vitripennis]|nr:hypothetical protein J6590_058164 [Homalodisca vitripennis]